MKGKKFSFNKKYLSTQRAKKILFEFKEKRKRPGYDKTFFCVSLNKNSFFIAISKSPSEVICVS